MTINKNHLWYFVLAIPMIVFFSAFFYYTIDAPINDDYAILNFLNNCISTDEISEKIKLIFSQHNEHRIVYDRIWTIICYKLNGTLNLNTIALIGNLSLVGIAMLFFNFFLKTKKHLLLFLPISCFIFNFSSWENMTFAMATLSNFSVLYFILLSLYYITLETLNKRKNLYLSILFFLLATLTQGGGLFLFPVSLLILIYKKEKKNIFIYLLLTLPIIFLYFSNYLTPTNSLPMKSVLLEYNYKIGLFAFAFLGNAFNYFLIYSDNIDQSILTTTIIGFVLFCIFLYITYTKYYKTNLFIYSVLLIIIISSFATSISRVSFGIEYAGSSRYRINGIIFFVAIYFWFVETYSIKKKYLLLLGPAILFYYININLKQYEYLYIREKQTSMGVLLYNSGDINYLNGDKKDLALYKNILNVSKKLGTYNLPTNEQLTAYFPYSNEHLENNLFSKAGENLSYNIDTIIEMNDSYLIEGWACLGNQNTNKQKVYIGIENSTNNKTIFYNVKKIERFDLNLFFNRNDLKYGGFMARIRKNDINKGVNKISIMVEVNELKKIDLTQKEIIK